MLVEPTMALTLPDLIGLRSHTPHLHVLLVAVGQFNKIKMRKDPWYLGLQESKAPVSLKDQRHTSLKVIHLKA